MGFLTVTVLLEKVVSLQPNAQPGGPGHLTYLAFPLRPVRHGDPASSYVTAGEALGILEALKPSHQDLPILRQGDVIEGAFYEIVWKKVGEPDRSQMTIWRMRIACWIPKATNTHSQYVTPTAFPLQQWLHERPSMLCCTYFGCLVT
jgi:hypothetical protein